MKFNELISEQRTIKEAPMGLLKTAGHKVLSKVSSTSAGKLETGTAANQLYNDFKKYLGQTGQEAEADVVLNFLQSRGLPTEDAEAVIKSAGDNQPGPIGQAVKATADGAVDAAKGAIKKAGGAIKTAATTGMEKLKGAMANKQPADSARQEPNLGEPAGDQATGSAQGQQTNKPTASYGRSTGFDPVTMKNKSEPLGPDVVGGIPSTTSPLNALTPKSNDAQPAAEPNNAKPKSRPQGGGRVAGQLSQTPSAVRRRQKRASGKTSSAIGQFVKTQLGDNPIRMKAGESIEYHYNRLIESLEYEPITEALSKGVLDKVFLAAVQNAAKVGGGQQSTGQSQQGSGGVSGGGQQSTGQSQDTKQGGFLAGLKQGWQGGPGATDDGQIKGNVNIGQLAQLLQMDPRELSAALIKLRQGQGLSRTHVNTLSNAFISMYKADPQTTVRIANMLKRVSFEEK